MDRLDELAGHDCISYVSHLSPGVWTFARDKAEIAVPVHARLFVGSAEAACDAACAGLTRLLIYHIQAALERGELVTLLDEFQPPALPVHLIYTADWFLPIKVRAFLDFAVPRLKRVRAG